MTVCQLKAGSTDVAEWSTPDPPECAKVVGLAFLLSEGDDGGTGAVRACVVLCGGGRCGST